MADGPDPLQRTLLISVGALAVAVAVTLTLTTGIPRLSRQPRLAMVLRLKTLVSTFNVTLLVYLTGSYVTIYRDIPNRFTLSLILFSCALLLYALTSNPLVHLLFGFRGLGLGPFAVLPDVFAAVAVVVLLYQSYA